MTTVQVLFLSFPILLLALGATLFILLVILLALQHGAIRTESFRTCSQLSLTGLVTFFIGAALQTSLVFLFPESFARGIFGFFLLVNLAVTITLGFALVELIRALREFSWIEPERGGLPARAEAFRHILRVALSVPNLRSHLKSLRAHRNYEDPDPRIARLRQEFSRISTSKTGDPIELVEARWQRHWSDPDRQALVRDLLARLEEVHPSGEAPTRPEAPEEQTGEGT